MEQQLQQRLKAVKTMYKDMYMKKYEIMKIHELQKKFDYANEEGLPSKMKEMKKTMNSILGGNKESNLRELKDMGRQFEDQCGVPYEETLEIDRKLECKREEINKEDPPLSQEEKIRILDDYANELFTMFISQQQQQQLEEEEK